MIRISLLAGFCCLLFSCNSRTSWKIFDVHIHGTKDVPAQISALRNAGVYKAAVSTSWDLQGTYRDQPGMKFLRGLMLPCPNGKVPYSLQPCYSNGEDWPPINWVEIQVQAGNIQYFGEILSQYYGISSSDSLLFPYYALAEKYSIPVGIHTGGAGPDHGSPNFKLELGNPNYMERLIAAFPDLKVWIMHAGDQFYKETIALMKKHAHVYADISVISNPDIVPNDRFAGMMKEFIDAGLEDRLMFGTDNGDVVKVINAVDGLNFLSDAQKSKIFYKNAEAFFTRRAN